jgi:Xaa-Pro aminopeptidase
LNEVYLDRARYSYADAIKYEKDCVKDFIFSKGYKKVGIDSITLSSYKSLQAKFRKLIRPSDICEQARSIKSKKEIGLLAHAGKIAADAMSTVADLDIIGMSEFDLSAEIEYRIRKHGSEKPPFSQGMLCLSGPNTRFPHAPTSDRKIREGDLVILDLGAVYRGYHSDMTRTIEVGEVSQEKLDIRDFMKSLKEEAIEWVELGSKISELHKMIEEAISKKGYKFAHLSGHGVGLEIHEKPSLGPTEEDVFREGMVFTIEPGIYTSSFGARSEDTIALVGKNKKIITQ